MIEAQTPAFRLVYAFENASQITCTRLHYKCNNKHDSVVPAVDTGIHAVRVPTTGMRASEQVEQFKLAPLSGCQLCPVSHHEDCRHVLGRLVPFPPLSAPLRHTCKITKIFEICVCAVCLSVIVCTSVYMRVTSLPGDAFGAMSRPGAGALILRAPLLFLRDLAPGGRSEAKRGLCMHAFVHT